MSDSFEPVKIIEADVNGPFPNVPVDGALEHRRYGSVMCLVRNGIDPIGIAEFPVRGVVLTGEELKAHIDAQFPRAGATRPRTLPKNLPYMDMVIATRDRPDSLARCLDSLLAQSHDGFSIVVADSAPSSDDTAAMIRSRYAGTGRVKYVRDERPGLGRAHNAGMSLVTADAVAFTDDDVVADRHWLASIAANFARNRKVGCVTGLIMPAELETRAQWWTEKHGGFGKGFRRREFDLDGNRPEGRLFPFTAGQFGSGANMAFSTAAVRSIGGFDDALGAGTKARGGDDLVAFYSVITNGFSLVYEPRAIVWHYHRRSEIGMERQAYNSGMGLGAYLTKVVVENPKAAARLVAALPAGLVHMLGRSSPKNQRLPSGYPQRFVWKERLGILAGVPGYFRSRAETRKAGADVAGKAPSALGSSWQG